MPSRGDPRDDGHRIPGTLYPAPRSEFRVIHAATGNYGVTGRQAALLSFPRAQVFEISGKPLTLSSELFSTESDAIFYLYGFGRSGQESRSIRGALTAGFGRNGNDEAVSGASERALTANGQTGSYTVSATTDGVSTAASFSLTNVGGAPASISARAGTPQSATVNTAFGTPLQATVKDAGNNPLSGVTVTFTAPATGASAAFSGSATATAVTNASGIASAPALTANGQTGSYTVSATAAEHRCQLQSH